MTDHDAPVYAAFVSPHGFGHAARASAVLRALHDRTGARFLLFSTVPRWFFDESLEGLYEYHEVETDVGLVQRSALEHDLDATLEALDDFPALTGRQVVELAGVLEEAGARAVLCDIAPLGIAVADHAGVPSLLLENFTWDWLYEPFHDRVPGLAEHSRLLAEWFDRAQVHLQTEPLCRLDMSADALLPPISRPPRRDRDEVRAELGIPDDESLVLLTMGGVGEELPFLDRLAGLDTMHVMATGTQDTHREGRLHCFSNETRLYLPDYVEAADGVVAKLGYGTAAEVWAARTPMAWVSRGDFRETEPLRRWAESELAGFEIAGDSFADGDWIDQLPELVALTHERDDAPGGADDPDLRVETPAHMAARHLEDLAEDLTS